MNQTQEQVEQLIIERDELLRKNENLTRGLMQFNDKVKQVHLLYNQKTETYHKNTMAFRAKIKQYETKIKQLQKQIDELNSGNNNYIPDNDNLNIKRGLMQNYNINRGKKIYDNNVESNRRNLTYELRESQKDKDEEQNDLSQKKYLENFK